MINRYTALAAAGLALFAVAPAFAQDTGETSNEISLSSDNDSSTSYQFYDRGSNSNNTANNTMVNPNAESWYGDNSLVASNSLSGYITGIASSFSSGEDAGTLSTGVSINGNSFQNSSGITSSNINSGVGAMQNSGVSINVTPVTSVP